MKTYIGIDPGAAGFLVAIYSNGHKTFLGIKDAGWRDVAKWLTEVRMISVGLCVCCMESVHAVYSSSAKATFSFGETFGVLQGMLIALGVPYHLVPPKTWQKEMWIAEDKVYKSSGGKKTVDNKPTSINAARRLFPDVDFRRTPKCSKPDDNKCDAMLICEYGRRKNL